MATHHAQREIAPFLLVGLLVSGSIGCGVTRFAGASGSVVESDGTSQESTSGTNATSSGATGTAADETISAQGNKSSALGSSNGNTPPDSGSVAGSGGLPGATSSSGTNVASSTGETTPGDLTCGNGVFKIGNECVNASPFYEWYRPAGDGYVGGYFYTLAAGPACLGKTPSDPACGGELVNESDWSYIGIAFYTISATASTASLPGLTAFYRLVQDSTWIHAYTADANEVTALEAKQYHIEETYLIFASQVPGSVPLYHFNGSLGDNFFSTASHAPTGYTYSDIAGYVFTQ